jgi:hypothetical protein
MLVRAVSLMTDVRPVGSWPFSGGWTWGADLRQPNRQRQKNAQNETIAVDSPLTNICRWCISIS